MSIDRWPWAEPPAASENQHCRASSHVFEGGDGGTMHRLSPTLDETPQNDVQRFCNANGLWCLQPYSVEAILLMRTTKPTQPQTTQEPAQRDSSAHAEPVMPQIGEHLTPQTVLQMQRLRGNRATLAAIQRKSSNPVATDAETASFLVTGRYEYMDAKGTRWLLHINHVGATFTGTLEKRQATLDSSGERAYDKRSVYKISGQRDEDGKQKQEWSGTIEDGEFSNFLLTFAPTRDGSVLASLDYEYSGKIDLTQTSTQPLMQGMTFADSKAGKMAQLAHENPLDQFQHIQLRIFQKQLLDKLDGYYQKALGFGGDYRAKAEAIAINNLVKSFFETQWLDKRQHPLAQRQLQMALLNAQRNGRTQYSWLLEMVQRYSTDTADIQKYIGIGGAGAVVHKYSFSFNVVGLEAELILGFGLFTGSMTITKVSPPTWQAPETYSFILGSAGGGFSAGVKFHFDGSGTMETPHEWMPHDFQGWVSFLGLEASSTHPDKSQSVGYGITGVFFTGSSGLPTLAGDASGSFNSMGYALAAGASGIWGYISQLGKPVNYSEIAKHSANAPRPAQVKATQSAEKSIHFAINSPDLNDVGKDALNAMAAENLALFSNPNTEITIDGHASRSGSADFNDRLSQKRADTVAGYLRGIVGKQLKAKIKRVKGHGEREAAKTDADSTENAAWRKVEVKLNGTTVITLN